MDLKSKKSFLMTGISFLVISYVFFLFYGVSIKNLEIGISDIFGFNTLYQNFNLLLIAIIFATFWFSFVILSSLFLSYKNDKTYKISFFIFLIISSLIFLNNRVMFFIHFISFLVSIFFYSSNFSFKKSFKKIKVYVLIFSLLFAIFSLGYTFYNRGLVENALIESSTDMAYSILEDGGSMSGMLGVDQENIKQYINEEDLPEGMNINDLNNLNEQDLETLNVEGITQNGSLDKDFLEDQVSEMMLTNELMNVIVTFLPIVVSFIVFGSLMFLSFFVKAFTFLVSGLLYLGFKKMFKIDENHDNNNNDENMNENNVFEGEGSMNVESIENK
ncbi:MAG: hypothetical protein ACOCRX_03465 [Candidatus Woesearchaeota archaeon]